MPTGGSSDAPAGRTGHLSPTGGSMDDYVARGIEQAQAVVDDYAKVKPAINAYTRRVITPAARAAYVAAAPLAQEVAGRGHEGLKLWEAVDDLRSLPGTVGDQLLRSFSGEDIKVPAEQSTRKALEDLEGLKRRLSQLSWKQPAKLAAALEKITELEESLQWREIASKVVQ